MKIFVTILMTSFVLVSCKFNKTFYASCEDYCNRSKVDDSNILASVVIPGDRRCHNMFLEALDTGKKLGVCGFNMNNPDPEACQALKDQAKEECKNLPPDPSMMDQTVSGTTVFKDGKPFLIDAKPVIVKGEVCSCNQSK